MFCWVHFLLVLCLWHWHGNFLGILGGLNFAVDVFEVHLWVFLKTVLILSLCLHVLVCLFLFLSMQGQPGFEPQNIDEYHQTVRHVVLDGKQHVKMAF